MTYQKIISLLPAATEIIYELGLGHLLVGRSHVCDYPAEARSLPVCTSLNFDADLDSEAIDEQVRSMTLRALSIYDIDAEMIQTLAPDLIITQSQCEVCAVSLQEVEECLSEMSLNNVKVISFAPQNLAGIYQEILLLGRELGMAEKAADLMERVDERKDIIRHKLKFITDKPKVACVEWLSPLMISGNWIPEMVELAGGQALLASSGEHSPYIESDELIAADPEILILMPCGFTIEQTLKEFNLIQDIPGFQSLRAVKENRVYIADGSHYFNRPGPRITDSIEILAEIINPKQFVFGYEGAGWIRMVLT